MTTDADLAQICAKLYDAANPETIGGVSFSITKLENAIVLAFRGSDNIPDWMRDFDAVPVWDDQLGFVHQGFFMGVRETYTAIKPRLFGAPLYIIGHSLGGGHARDVAALCAVDGIKVKRLVTFGSPRPGFANLARIIQKSGMEHVSYRNRNDPVPLVPFPLPLMDWQHPEDWTAVDVAPAATDLEPLRDHHIELYEAGVAKLVDQVATA